MLLRTLGELRLEGAKLTRPKPLLLLTYLAVEGPKDRRFLSRLFWPTAPSPLTNLRTALSQVRRAAPGAIQVKGTRLSTEVALDVTSVLDSSEPLAEVGLSDVYPGPFLEGMHLADWGPELEEWVFATRELVADTVRTRLLERAEQLASNGNTMRAAQETELAWRLPGSPEPTPETMERAYRLLVAGGSPHAARLQAEAADYGIELRAAEHVDRWVAFPAARAHRRPGSGLRSRATSFEGRDLELLELSRLLNDPGTRLVTLVGPGGTGKTSLAAEAATQALRSGDFPNATFVSHEGSVVEGDQLSALAHALGMASDEPPGVASIARTIGDDRHILVLDNCEHLVGQLGPVTELIGACRGLTVLATSREPLELPGEQLFEVGGLRYPGPSEALSDEARLLDSVRLFVRRAKRVDLGFTLDDDDLPHVAAICRAVVGSPLAIELAAGLVTVLSLEEIAEELLRDQDVLSSTGNDVPERHRSLRATFEHSWRLLTEDQRDALAALGVFAGGFTRESAARVADLTIPVLRELIGKSLVQRQGDGRYRTHPLVQAYALEKLRADPASEAEVWRAHTEHLVEQAAAAATGRRSERPSRLGAVMRERENYRAAIAHWQQAGNLPSTLRLAAAVWPALHASGDWREAREALELAVMGWDVGGPFEPSPTGPTVKHKATERTIAPILAEAFRGIGILAAAQGDTEAAHEATSKGLAIAETLGDDVLTGSLVNHMGVIALRQGAYADADKRFREALEVRRRADDRAGVAATLNNLGALAGRNEDMTTADAYYRESLSLFRELGDRPAVALLLSNLGDVAEYRGEMTEARDLYVESLAVHENLGNVVGVAACLTRLSAVARRAGDLVAARAQCLEGLHVFSELGDVEGVAECLNELGMIHAGDRRTELAATAWGAMTALLESANAPLPASQVKEHEDAVASARASSDERAFELAWARGRALTYEQAVEFALPERRSNVNV